MRGKIAQLEEALDCCLDRRARRRPGDDAGHHRLLHRADRGTDREDRGAGQPYELQIAQLDEVPGTGVITAQDIIAEVGADMTVFPTAAHLVSWARWCPQLVQSGGKRKGANASGRGNRYLSAALGEAAIGAGRTQSFPGAKYLRLVKRMPKRKALVATGNSLLTIYHALLSDPEAAYADLGTDYYERRANIRRQARNHLRGLERLGYKVTIEPIDPDTGELQATAS